MSYRPLPVERNVSKFDLPRGFGYTRTPGTAGLPAAANSAITCSAREVALIDEIAMSTTTTVAATNRVITLNVNGVASRFLFPGVAAAQRTDRLVWRPRGNLVVHPGQSLTMSGSGLFLEHAYIRFRKKGLVDAIRDGDIPGHGTLPNIVGSGSTVAATAKALIPAVAGKCVEIRAMVFTGHSFNAAADNARIGFWDGTTGNFTANGVTIARAWRQNANVHYAKPLVIGNTDGCIQGPSGSGVYIQSSANLAGTPAPCEWVLVYRYIDAAKLEVASATGAVGQTITRGEKFWVNTEAAVTSVLGEEQKDRLFAAATGTNLLVKVKGWVNSATIGVGASFASFLGLGLGTGISAAAGTATLGELLPLYNSDNGGAAAAVGHLFGQDDTLCVTNLSSIPCFIAGETGAGDIANRSQTVWGRFEPTRITQQDTQGQSQITFIV